MAYATSVDRVVAADPGLVRLYMGVRATGAVGTALGILLLLRAAFHLPMTIPLLGAALGMTWITTVNDATRRDQRITTAVLWLPAAAFGAIGTLTAPNRVLGDCLFVFVLFLSMYVRKYGPRGASLGTIAVISFFFALFLRLSVRDVGWQLVALAVTDACTFLFRFFLFPDNPRLAAHNAAAAFRARERLMAATIARARRRGRWTRALRQALDHHVLRLNETALVLDDLLRTQHDRMRVLDSELAAGEIADAQAADLSQELRPIKPLRLPPNLPVRDEWTPRGPFRVGTQLDTGSLAPTTRQAIQLSAAGTLAIILGELLSPQRWYWAVIATFVVFLGTSSSGEARNKAWSRVAGTAFGVLAGIAVTYPVRMHDDLAFCLLLVCLFAAVYTIRISYGIMIFFLTIVLSLLYVLLGYFSDRLLGVRLLETALGAALGGIAATLLVPIPTRRVLSSVTIEALRRLDDLIGSVVDRIAGDSRAEPIVAARRFDEALQSVRTQIEPLVTPMRIGDNDVLRTRLVLMAACGYYARALAAIAYEAQPVSSIEPIRAEREAIRRDIRAIVALNEGVGPGADLSPAAPRTAGEAAALIYLHRIDRALHGLASTVRGT